VLDKVFDNEIDVEKEGTALSRLQVMSELEIVTGFEVCLILRRNDGERTGFFLE
jgi:hypothetical protein